MQLVQVAPNWYEVWGNEENDRLGYVSLRLGGFMAESTEGKELRYIADDPETAGRLLCWEEGYTW